MHLSGSPFYQADGVDQFRGERPAGNGKVLHGPLGLGPVIRGRREANLPHRVVFDAILVHIRLPNLSNSQGL